MTDKTEAQVDRADMVSIVRGEILEEVSSGNCPFAEHVLLVDAMYAIDHQAERIATLDSEIAMLKKAYQELGKMFHDQIVAQQAAWIEWQHGQGAEAGMRWIENGLCGPGHIPEEGEPYGTEAQAYFDANQSDPFPTCHCGRPSNILWMGKGFCSDAHYRSAQAVEPSPANPDKSEAQ